ncbi:antA/AntB antirepressor family protein [uncultured Tissierella sp.]|uniref:antA/AntB antirepressor family protein n=1 Tax=uncultured Tissierella sp. TaxID=448160 RepID=UPI0035A5F0A1
MFRYGFIENQDLRAYVIKTKHANGRDYEATDYEITVDMGKELAMLQKSEKGKMARKYFIELEKK